MAFSTADLTSIETAIATGELTVEIEGKRVTYRSIDDLRKARNLIMAELQASGATAKVTRTSYATRVSS